MVQAVKNGKVRVDDTHMDYICFGRGKKALVMLPGLGDGLRTVRGMAAPFSVMYREYAGEYRVYVFSRKAALPSGSTSPDMARDQAAAMEALGIEKAHILGVSQGGTIAQHLAIAYPQLVDRLVLAVTFSRPNDTLRQVVGHWLQLAEQDRYTELMMDTVQKMYSERYRHQNRFAYPIATRLGKPKSWDRFTTMARACLAHDAYDALGKIACPTLVIGGKQDRVATPQASAEIAQRIGGSTLYMYEQYGHAAYEEAPDFNRRVLRFLAGESGGRLARRDDVLRAIR